MHKDSNVDCFASKIEKPLYDEPSVMWAYAYVALSIKTSIFFIMKHVSWNNILGIVIWKQNILYLGCSKHIAWKKNYKKWKVIRIQGKDIHEIFSTLLLGWHNLFTWHINKKNNMVVDISHNATLDEETTLWN